MAPCSMRIDTGNPVCSGISVVVAAQTEEESSGTRVCVGVEWRHSWRLRAPRNARSCASARLLF
jgi:hypothetical protein